MATSPLQGRILYATGDFDAGEPADTVLVRDGLVGSALHLADEAAQVRVCWVATTEALSINGETRAEITPAAGGSIEVGEWYAMPLRARFAPKVRADGTGYRLRVSLAGASSAGDAVDFALVIAPARAEESRIDVGTGVPEKVYSTVTSTSPAWLTADAGGLMLDVPAETIAAALDDESAMSTREDIGGTPTTVIAPMLEVRVYGRTSDASSAPLLYGVVVAEYIGL